MVCIDFLCLEPELSGQENVLVANVFIYNHTHRLGLVDLCFYFNLTYCVTM